MSLDALEHAAKVNPVPPRGRRHRLEHIETVDPADIPRFGALGVIASQQPFHGTPTPSQMTVWTANIGDDRASRGWARRSWRAGGRLAFGSDWPVVTLDPRPGIHTAVTRTTIDGQPEEGWYPAERISLTRPSTRTRGAAWASFDEQRKGTLARDMLADVVILSSDIFAPDARMMDAVVETTIFDGKVVYTRPRRSRPRPSLGTNQANVTWRPSAGTSHSAGTSVPAIPPARTDRSPARAPPRRWSP